MNAFNLALARLYDFAEQLGHAEFSGAALRLLRPWLGFDIAMFWTGDPEREGTRGAPVLHVFLQLHDDGCDREALEPVDLREIANVIQPLVASVSAPVISDWRREASRMPGGCPRLRNYPHLMLFGERGNADKEGRWLMLCRRADRSFTDTEADNLHAAWFHLVRAREINLLRLLERHDTMRPERASAVVNEQGYILCADPQFHRLLQVEWPDYRRLRLMGSALTGMLQGKSSYRGRHVVITMARDGGYVSCYAKGLQTLAGLTLSEYTVAQGFASGLSHKAIARATGRSPNTVRNQIARLYDKLGVNNKAALAQHFAEHLSRRKGSDTER